MSDSLSRFFAREEFFGWLLFSPERHRYIVPVSRAAIRALDITIRDRRTPNRKDLREFDPREACDALGWLRSHGCAPNTIEVVRRNPQPDSLSAPLNVYFDYTSVCNLSCTMCYDEPKRRGIKREREMSLEEIDGIFHELRHMGVFRVDLAGGEPLLFPKALLAYLHGARSRSISVSITTNATRLTKDLARRILEYDLKTITVSIDGYDAETNDAVRGAGAFDLARRGVRNLLEARRECGSSTRVAIKYTFPPSLSEEEVRRYVALGQQLGVDQVKLNPMRPSGEASGDLHLIEDPKRYYVALESIRRVAESTPELEVSGPVNPATCFGGRIPHIRDWGCVAGKELITIDSVGNVRPCSMMNDFVAGNVRHARIESIYLESRLLELRGRSLSECNSCSAYSTCRGGCRVRSQAAGDFFAKDPLCPVGAGQPLVPGPTYVPAFEELGLPHSL